MAAPLRGCFFNMHILKKLVVVVVVGLCLLAAAWVGRSTLLPYLCEDPQPYIARHFADGGFFTDRNGRTLRVFPAASGDYSMYAPLASHPATLLSGLLMAEDRNFYQHPGFDATAILRALWQNLSSRRVISGASTITQQLIRIVRPRPRTVSTKIAELLMAIRLEMTLSKDEILEKYLNAVSMFGNVRGICMAASLLFGKNVEMLNLGESAALVAAIQAPGRLDPFTRSGNQKLHQRRRWVLDEMLHAGKCSTAEHKNAVAVVIPDWQRHRPFNAPHFCDLAVSLAGRPVGRQVTTIDMGLQNLLTSTITAHMPRLMKRGALQAGGMIVDARTLEILAMAGSVQYGPLAGGFNNVCLARRSGGSILKPFLYALALEKGYYPSFIIPDTMQSFKTPRGEYQPWNADRKSYGPVTIRSALGNSLNISAVKMLNMLGVKDFYSMLVDLELLPSRPGAADFFGLGLAIGNPELRMFDLVRAYAVLVNGGFLKPLLFFLEPGGPARTGNQIVSAPSAYMVFDMLADPSARLLTFGNPSFFKTAAPVAIKTGTSTEYRDCWLIAANSRFVIALWVGNFSGAPTRGLSGATACGPIFKNLIDYLETSYPCESLLEPEGVTRHSVCSISGERPGQFCPSTGRELFAADTVLPPSCSFHQTADAIHELPSDYASWLRQRRKILDLDPFQLINDSAMADPWNLSGLQPREPGVVPVASGPMLVPAAANSFESCSIRIVSPHEGDCYVMAASHENFALLRAIPSQPVPEIIWLINGSEFVRTPPPYEAYWPLAKGSYRICAITEGDQAAEIEIRVE